MARIVNDAAREKLKRVMGELIAECMHWYENDIEQINQMSQDDLKTCVLDYMGRRDYYMRKFDDRKDTTLL